MSTSSRPSSSAGDVALPSAAAAAAATRTPKRVSQHRRKTNKQLSAKQLDKIVRNLSAVQRSVGHLRSDSVGSLSNVYEASTGVADDDAQGHHGRHKAGLGGENDDDEDDEQQRQGLAPYALLESDEAGISADPTVLQALSGLGAEHNTQQQTHETQAWLQRRGVDRSLVKGLGKGPDGLALAKVAAKAYKGKENAPQDAFVHEASFVFNPLMQRVPQQSPRKQQRSRPHPTVSKQPHTRAESSSSGARLNRQDSLRPGTSQSAKGGGEVQGRAGPIPVPAPSAGDDATDNLSEAPIEVQEALMLEDLLFAFMGIEGQYIQYAHSYHPEELGSRLLGAKFTIDETVDASLRDLVYRILPLASHYTAIYALVETESSLEFGTVVHAMCAALRTLLKEYQVLIVQLEHQMATSAEFTLQRLWFYVQPTLRAFAITYSFLREIIDISHANIIDGDEDDDDDDEERDLAAGADGSSSGGENDDADSSTDSLDRRRRELLQHDDSDEDGVIGGVVQGGELIAMLWDRVVKLGGDETAHKLFTELLHSAAQPYARIALRWITTGFLSDTYDEFLVVEDPRVTRASLESDPTDAYWERRYMLRDEAMLAQKEHERQQGLDLDSIVDDNGTRGVLTGGSRIPAFLEPWKRKILLAGRYLNVIRECGREVPTFEEDNDLDTQPDISITADAFFQQIETAYQRANIALLDMLLNEHNIVARLRSMKHYFFQSQSDYFSSFLEAAGRELRKEVVANKVRDVTIMRLQSHLGMVLGSSNCVGYDDPFREDVRIQLASENAYDQLKRIAEIRGGIEAARAQAKLARPKDKERISLLELLQFDLHVKFPVSLVISKKNILRWQFLQRPIIHFKATERALCDVWMEHQDDAWRDRERGNAALLRWKMRVFHLRHRILFFVQQVLAFVTAEVIEPNWRDLEEKMARATTVDEFLKDHFDFLNLCRKECMLTDLRYVEMMSKLMSVAVVFCENRVRFRDQLHMEREAAKRRRAEDSRASHVSEEVQAFLERIEGHWEKRLRTFKDIVALLSTTDNPAALPLSYRLQSA